MYYADRSIILTRKVFREDDLIISAYSEEHGKVVAVGRGAKKILSKLAGHLEPVSLVYFNLTKGKNINKLIGAENIKSYKAIKNDLEKMQLAGRFLGLVDKLVLEGNSDRRIFMLLERYLEWLENNKIIKRYCVSSPPRKMRGKETGDNILVIDKLNRREQNYNNPESRAFEAELAELVAEFKLLYLLGLNPALKTEFKSEIDFIVKNSLQEIEKNPAILKSFNVLKKIIDREIKMIIN